MPSLTQVSKLAYFGLCSFNLHKKELHILMPPEERSTCMTQKHKERKYFQHNVKSSVKKHFFLKFHLILSGVQIEVINGTLFVTLLVYYYTFQPIACSSVYLNQECLCSSQQLILWRTKERYILAYLESECCL